MNATPQAQHLRGSSPHPRPARRPSGHRSLAIIGAAAAALSAGLLLPSPSASAAPLNCSDYIYPSSFEVKQDNGILTAINNNGNRFDGSGASYTMPGSGVDTRGISTGSRTGRNIDITVNWNGGGSSHLTGRIDDDLVARGTTVNNQGVTNTWYSLNKFTCVPPPAAKPPVVKPPVDNPDGNNPPAQQGTTAKALDDVDVFDQPGGVGSPRPGVFIKKDATVQLLERRADNWCHVSGPNVPGGDGWAFGDFIG